MRRFSPPDYLANHDTISQKYELQFAKSSFLKQELDRIAKGEPMRQLDVARYKLERPSGKQEKDIKSWRAARDNAQSQLEHQHTRIMNLELMSKFGTNAWRQHNEVCAGAIDAIEPQ